MLLYLEDPNSGARLSLVPPPAGESSDWIQERKVYHVVYEGTSANGEPRLALGGVMLRRLERDVGRSIVIKWEWKPDFYAGRISLALTLADGSTHTNTVILDPARDKLTRERYEVMVAEIYEQAETCFKLSPVSKHVRLGRKIGDRWLIHLEFARRYVVELQRLIDLLVAAPRKQLEQDFSILPVGAAHQGEPSSAWIAAEGVGYLREAGNGWSLPGRGKGYSVSDIQHAHVVTSFDTYENQFVLHFLRTLRQCLVDTHQTLRRAKNVVDQEKSLVAVCAKEAAQYIQKIDFWLNKPLFQKVGKYAGTQRGGSHVLLKHPVYSRLHQLWLRFRRLPEAFDGSLLELPLEKTWQLYEYWCYMMVVRCLGRLGLIEDASGLFHVKESVGKVALALLQGEESRVVIKGGHVLYFHRNYNVVTHGVGTRTVAMQPDIVLEVMHRGETQSIVVLDPKYRVSSKSLAEAIKDIHSYCHGICRFPERKQLISVGIILAPTGAHHIFKPGFGDEAGLEGIQLIPGEVSTITTLEHRLSQLLSPLES